jgi:hypothetical protein
VDRNQDLIRISSFERRPAYPRRLGLLSGATMRVLSQPLPQRSGVDRACALAENLIVPKDHQRRNTSDAISFRKLRLGFRVEFQKTHRRFHLRSDGVIDGCHHLAGTAPSGPEIDYDGDVIVVHVSVEALRADWNRRADEQRLVTAPAFRLSRIAIA